MSKPILYFVWLIIALMLAFYIRYFYMAYYPFKTVDIYLPIHVLTPKVKAGADLIYQTHYCRYFSGSGKVTRTLYGPDTVPTPAVDTVTKLGCDTVNIHLNVPANTTPGTYHLEIAAEFTVNPYQIARKNWTTDSFIVY
jgi:hypothetical protein